jgi:hypothetical protein
MNDLECAKGVGTDWRKPGLMDMPCSDPLIMGKPEKRPRLQPEISNRLLAAGSVIEMS